MGEIIYAKFGDDISPTEFEDMLTFIFLNDEIRDHVEAEKKKRKAAEKAIVTNTEITDTLSEQSPPKNAKSESVANISYDDVPDSDDDTDVDDED